MAPSRLPPSAEELRVAALRVGLGMLALAMGMREAPGEPWAAPLEGRHGIEALEAAGRALVAGTDPRELPPAQQATVLAYQRHILQLVAWIEGTPTRH